MASRRFQSSKGGRRSSRGRESTGSGDDSTRRDREPPVAGRRRLERTPTPERVRDRARSPRRRRDETQDREPPAPERMRERAHFSTTSGRAHSSSSTSRGMSQSHSGMGQSSRGPTSGHLREEFESDRRRSLTAKPSTSRSPTAKPQASAQPQASARPQTTATRKVGYTHSTAAVEKAARQEFKKMSLAISKKDKGAAKPGSRAEAAPRAGTPEIGAPCYVEPIKSPHLPPVEPPPGASRHVVIGDSPRGTGKFEPGRHPPQETIEAQIIEPNIITHGSRRVVYKGIYTHPRSKIGQLCVFKDEEGITVKGTYTYDKVLLVQRFAKTLAVEFNKDSISPMSIEYVDIAVSFSDRTKFPGGPREDKAILVEDFISGDFIKFSNNYGYDSRRSDTLSAFMHWSFVKTEGRVMIGDLQGARLGNKYVLTDPALMSNLMGEFFGRTDTGVEGIAMFFKNHECTRMCRNLSKPSLDDILPFMPRAALDRAERFKDATVLSHDKVIEPGTAACLSKVLYDVAKRNQPQ